MADIIPFERRKPPAAPTAEPKVRITAREQNADSRRGYAKARLNQEGERLIAAGRVVPARITMALDIGGHEGPAVDLACGTFEGNPAGDVDMWETALAAPSPEQVRALSKLTGYPMAWFYEAIEPGPLTGPVWMCWTGRRGCELVAPNVVDERGVLLYEGKPREMPSAQGALF